MNHSLSLIYLVYNEQDTLAAVLDEALGFCRDHVAADWQIVVVDDGSGDASATIAADYAGRHAAIDVVRHERNRGMGAAMATGVAAARCDYFVFLSADGQAPVSELPRLLSLMNRADIVVSTYERGRSMSRSVLSGGLRVLMRVAAGIRFQLEGLYVFPTAVAQRLAPAIEADTFFFSFELIDRGLAEGLTLAQTTMAYRQREAGQSKVANLRRVRRVAAEVLRYARRKRARR